MKCTNCNAELAAGTKFCTVCGQPVPQATAPKCPNCNADIEPGSKFCTVCGQTLVNDAAPMQPPVGEPAPAPAPKEKVPFGAMVKGWFATAWLLTKAIAKATDAKLGELLGNKKKIAYFAIIAFVAVVLVTGIVNAVLPLNNGYINTEKPVIYAEDDSIYVLKGGKGIKLQTSAESVKNEFISIDGKTILFLDEDNNLQLVKGKKTVKVAEEIDYYHAAPYGNAVIYETEDAIMYCTTSKGKAVELFEYNDETELEELTCSPDGKSIAYTVEDEEGEMILYYFNGKESSKVKKCDGLLVGMSNGGKQIYVISTNDEGESSLYAYNTKGDSTKLGRIDDDDVVFNLSGSEVMFQFEDKTYISAKGKEAVKVAKATGLEPILPYNTNDQYDNYEISEYSTIFPQKSLFNHVYTGSSKNENGDNENAVYYVTKKEDKCIKLLSGKKINIRSVTIDLGADYLYYLDDDELMCLKISHGESAKDKAKTIADDVSSFVISPDRKYAYYIDDDNLMAVNAKKGGKAKKISKNDVYGVVVDSDGYAYYMDDEYDWYATKGTKAGKKILSEAMPTGAAGCDIYFADEDYVYAARGRSKPKKLFSID